MQEEANEFGIDWNGPAVLEDVEAVELPLTECPLQPHELAVLQNLVNPLAECGDLGVHLYATTKLFVGSLYGE